MRKNKLVNHLKKAVSTMDARPLLQCVNYNENGSIYATDSHVAIRISDFHEHEKEFNLNLFTMEIKEGFYPASNLDKNLEITKLSAEINVDINLLVKALKPFIDKTSFTNCVDLIIKEKLLVIKSNRLGEFKIEVPLHDCEGEIEISCQLQYLINGLQFIKDAKTGKKELSDGLVLIQFSSPVSPFKLNLDDEFEYLITPVRTY